MHRYKSAHICNLHSICCAFSPLLSHLARLHVRVWIDVPLQVLLVTSHDLPLCCVPVPHVTVHSVHSDHGDQPSSLSLAAKKQYRLVMFFLAPANSITLRATTPREMMDNTDFTTPSADRFIWEIFRKMKQI